MNRNTSIVQVEEEEVLRSGPTIESVSCTQMYPKHVSMLHVGSPSILKSHLKDTLEEGTARTRQLTATCWWRETLSDLGWSRQTGGNATMRGLVRERLLPSWFEALQLKLPDMFQSTALSCRVKSLDGSPNVWLFLYHCTSRGGGFALA